MGKSQLLKIVIAASVLITVGIALSVYYTYFVFHINAVSPPKNEFPTSEQTVILSFNQELAKNDTSQISLSPNIPAEIYYGDKEIRIELSQLLTQDTEFEVKLNSIRSSKNATLSQTIRFRVVYVAFNDLTDQQQADGTKNSDSFETDYPLTESLPLIANDFEIDYKFPASYEQKMPIIITSRAILELDPNTGAVSDKTQAEYYEALRTSRNKAIAFLKEQGYDSEKYRLVFAESELVEEFDGTFIGNENFGG